METVSFRNARDLRLAGLLHRADPDRIVVMAHGFCNDKSSQGRFDRIADALQREGLSVLHFDFAGCGESDDDTIAIGKEIEDLQAALGFARAAGYRRLALFGNSLGGTVCLRCGAPDVATMVVTGAGTGRLAVDPEFDWDAYYSREQMCEVREKGYLSDRVDGRWRAEVRIDRQMLLEYNAPNKMEVLALVACPVLLIHGNHPDDAEELMLLERSRRGLKHLPPGSRIEVISGAKHGFHDEIDRVIQLATDWYRERL
jgi:pimeloyl-ACP methyl ester carboxylesterase